MNYNKLSDSDKKKLIKQQYEVDRKSFQEIAKDIGTYANKIRRDAIKFKINIRNKSEAQSNALAEGKSEHPTKGKTRSLETKQKIGLSVLQSWETMDSDVLEKRKEKARINWENKSDDEKENILKLANDAVRQASKTGSKLEKFLLTRLLESGWNVEFHKEQSILNTQLQIDLFIPKINVAIEVDGPSHFEDVWGNEALQRNKKYDNKKTGLILGKGLYLIRIKQNKDFSKARASIIADQLEGLLRDIQDNKLNQDKILKIGD